jgi:hypothetical protein
MVLAIWFLMNHVSRADFFRSPPAAVRVRLGGSPDHQSGWCTHRRNVGVNHFSDGHFLTHRSQFDCGGTVRFGGLWRF